jgi:hypothetical protein
MGEVGLTFCPKKESALDMLVIYSHSTRSKSEKTNKFIPLILRHGDLIQRQTSSITNLLPSTNINKARCFRYLSLSQG